MDILRMTAGECYLLVLVLLVLLVLRGGRGGQGGRGGVVISMECWDAGNVD